MLWIIEGHIQLSEYSLDCDAKLLQLEAKFWHVTLKLGDEEDSGWRFLCEDPHIKTKSTF